MYKKAVWAGVVLFAVLVVRGVMQTGSVMDMLILTIAGGVIPGTGLVVPGQFILVVLAGLVMWLFAKWYRRHVERRRTMRRRVAQYRRHIGSKEDPSYSELIPGLVRARDADRAVRRRVDYLSFEAVQWLRSFNRPLNAQAVTLRNRGTAIRMDTWPPIRENLRHNLRRSLALLNICEERLRTYVSRMPTLF